MKTRWTCGYCGRSFTLDSELLRRVHKGDDGKDYEVYLVSSPYYCRHILDDGTEHIWLMRGDLISEGLDEGA